MRRLMLITGSPIVDAITASYATCASLIHECITRMNYWGFPCISKYTTPIGFANPCARPASSMRSSNHANPEYLEFNWITFLRPPLENVYFNSLAYASRLVYLPPVSRFFTPVACMPRILYAQPPALQTASPGMALLYMLSSLTQFNEIKECLWHRSAAPLLFCSVRRLRRRWQWKYTSSDPILFQGLQYSIHMAFILQLDNITCIGITPALPAVPALLARLALPDR